MRVMNFCKARGIGGKMIEPKYRAWDRQLMELFEVLNLEIKFRIAWLHTGCLSKLPRAFDDVVLMPFTGLVDKNGKEIYEGDIVSIDTDEFDLLVVKYETGIYWLMDGEQGMEYLSDYYNYVTVVGNIYENPKMVREVE